MLADASDATPDGDDDTSDLPPWAQPRPSGPPFMAPERCDADLEFDAGERGQWRFDFTVPPGDDAVLVRVLPSATPRTLTGLSFSGAHDDVITWSTYGRYTSVQQDLSPNALAMLVPQLPTANDVVTPGASSVLVDGAAATSPCFTVLGSSRADGPRALSLDVWLVGEQPISAEQASRDPHIQRVVATAEAALADAALTFDRIRFHDLPDAPPSWSPLLSRLDLEAMMAAVPQPSGDRAQVLAVPVFVVDGFGGDYTAGGGSLAGITAGIPIGLPGGDAGSGVVISSRQLGSELGDQIVGIVLAHELGHALGLYHTTELTGGLADPLDDTPVCTSGITTNAAACPDYLNLMFPFALRRGPLELSDQQREVVRAHPATRTEDP